MNKLTDNEIIKALEEYLQKCQNIKYGARQKILVDADFLKDVLDLINRQKAEIERLKEELKITRAYVHDNGLEWGLISIKKLVDDTKSEAIKELAKEFVADLSHMLTYDKDYIKAKIFRLVEIKQKEMVGE